MDMGKPSSTFSVDLKEAGTAEINRARKTAPSCHPPITPAQAVRRHELRDPTARGFLMGYKLGPPAYYLPTWVQCQAEYLETKPGTYPECGHYHISRKRSY